MGICQAYVGHMYWAYVMHDACNSSLITIALSLVGLLLELLEAV